MTATSTHKLTPAEIRTLRHLVANGGEMNGYAQPRHYHHSIPTLARISALDGVGYVEHVSDCNGCAARNYIGGDHPCERPLFYAGRRHLDCHYRVRITDAGRAALDADLADALS